MAATVDSQPVSPAAAYRPLLFTVKRVDPSLSSVTFIRPATSGDVSALGNGLVVGDILVQTTSDWDGVALDNAGWILLNPDCGVYAGIKKVLNNFDVGAYFYTVIDSADLGTFAFSPVGHARVYLNNYTIYMRVNVYTNPASLPVQVDLQGTPDISGHVTFDVSKVVQNYFSSDISRYALPIGGSGLIQDAYGVTALFYEVIVAEVYDFAGEAPFDPFDGEDHDGGNVIFTDTDYRVAVNAVHPSTYTDEVISPNTPATLDWSSASLGAYVLGQGAASFERKFLTHAPRMLTMASTDYFRLHMLTWSTPPAGISPYTMPTTMRLRFYNAATNALILDKQINLSQATPAFSVAVGPADLGAFVTLPAAYKVYVSATNDNILSEYFEITVKDECHEADRPLVILNPLGGVDSFTFNTRELDYANDGESLYTTTVRGLTRGERKWLVGNLLKRGKVDTLKRYNASGTGYNWTERTYKGANVVTRLSPTIVAPVIIETTNAQSASTGALSKPLTIDFRVGVDQYSQQG